MRLRSARYIPTGFGTDFEHLSDIWESAIRQRVELKSLISSIGLQSILANEPTGILNAQPELWFSI
jgi:hypothetical protein